MKHGAEWLRLVAWAVGVMVIVTVTYVVTILVALSAVPTEDPARFLRTAGILLILVLMVSGATRNDFAARALRTLHPALNTVWSILLVLLAIGLLLPMTYGGHLLWGDKLSAPVIIRTTADLLTWLVTGAGGVVLGVLLPPARSGHEKKGESSDDFVAQF